MSFQSKIEAEMRIAGIDLEWGERKPDGMCGLLAAETLRDRGLRVVVLDKGRGVGGRQRWDETFNQQVV